MTQANTQRIPSNKATNESGFLDSSLFKLTLLRVFLNLKPQFYKEILNSADIVIEAYKKFLDLNQKVNDW